jgi:hypothetical protein
MSLNRTLLCLSSGVLFLFLQQPATADAVKDTVLICDQGSPCTILDQSLTGLASASGIFSLGAGTADVLGTADATGGILRSYSSYSFTSSPTAGGQVNGNAQFFDTLTIDAPGLSGSTGYLQPSFAVTGTASASANAAVAIFVNAGPNCLSTGACQVKYVTGDTEIVFDPLPFTFGLPISLEMDLDAVTYYGPGSINALSDFSHTAVLNGLAVFQNSNATNPVSNATFTSPDGVTYSANGVVPEPNSLLLLATGLVSVALICRRRRLANPSN